MSGCTVEGCESKHYSKGLCRKHYLKARRAHSDEEDKPEEQKPTYIPPTEIKIGVPGTPPEGTAPTAPSTPLGPDGKPLPAKPGQAGSYSFSFGSLQVALAWEQLSRLAPDARPLELTPKQREELDAAFAAAGLTVNNPWIVIIGIIVPPTVLFIICNYDQIKLNSEKMFKDLARLAGGLKKKAPEPERLV
jgi:hypothetical protein